MLQTLTHFEDKIKTAIRCISKILIVCFNSCLIVFGVATHDLAVAIKTTTVVLIATFPRVMWSPAWSTLS